jgi:RNA polymerase sigma-70 factor (ECF subfamily)
MRTPVVLKYRMFLTGNPPFSHPMEETPETTTDDTGIDHALMARVAEGDHRAFRQLVERHQDAVVGTVTKMLGNTSDSEDIAQMVFIRVWKHARNYKPDNRFTTYLYTIVRNLVYNETRRRTRKRTVSTDQREDEQHLQHPAEESARPDATLLDTELRTAIDAAIGALPENQRLAVVLRRYENLPYEEIAEVLSTSVPSVKSLLFRARTTLRESLSKYMDA